MCIRIKRVRSKVRLSGNARIASVHGPPYLLQRLVWPITVWVFLVSAVVAVARWLVRTTDDRVVTASNPVRLPHITCLSETQ